MSRRVVILAGGRGTRLRPYTVVLPKPLMPIGEYSILEVIVRQLSNYGFDHITMAVNHQAEIVKALFNSGRKWGVHIDYSLEQKALGTIGPLKLIRDLPENCLVMNGDVLTDLNYGEFYEYHVQKKNELTVSICSREIRTEFGVIELNGDQTLHGFQEKPVTNCNVSMGIYMMSRRVLDIIPEESPYGFDDLMTDMMRMGRTAHVKRHDGYWLDIGRPEDYMKAVDMYETNGSIFLNKARSSSRFVSECA